MMIVWCAMILGQTTGSAVDRSVSESYSYQKMNNLGDSILVDLFHDVIKVIMNKILSSSSYSQCSININPLLLLL